MRSMRNMRNKNVYYLFDLRHGNVVYDISLNPVFKEYSYMLGLTSIKLAVMKMMTVFYKEKIFSCKKSTSVHI